MTAMFRSDDKAKQTIPLGTFGEPEEVVQAALYPASNGASFIPIATLLIDRDCIAGRSTAIPRPRYAALPAIPQAIATDLFLNFVVLSATSH